jgi:hypothetical protein
MIVFIVAIALVASAAFAGQQADRISQRTAAKGKPEVKEGPHAVGNKLFGNPGIITRAPLSEGFEGGAIPANWTKYDNDGDGYEWEAYSTTSAHTGSYVARVHYNSSGCDDWLITPKLTVASGDTLKFWAKSYSSSFLEDFEVLLSTTGTATGDFTVQLDDVASTPYDWTEYKYDLSTYDGQDIYIAVRCVSVDEYYLYVDDFSGPEVWVPAGPAIAFNTTDLEFGTVTIPGSADLPLVIYSVGGSDLTVSNVVSDNAHFTHDFPGSTVIPVGDSLVVTVTFTPTADPEETGNLTITHDGTKATSVITMSGSGFSGLLSEDFMGTFPPTGWTTYELGTTGGGWAQGTPGYDDDYCAWHDDISGGTWDDWLVSPAITMPAKATYELEFQQYVRYPTYTSIHSVMISDGSGVPPTDFTQLYEVPHGDGYLWEAIEDLDLTAYAGETIYLAFRYEGGYDADWSVDNVVVQEFTYVNEPPEITHDAKGDTDDTTPTLTAIITDVETFTATAYYETAKAFTPVTMTATGNPDEYSCDLPVGAYGTINYYIEAEDDSKGLVATTPTYSFDICPVVGTEVKYDDGTVEDATVWNAGYTDNRFAVQFTPPAYPCTLNTVKVGIIHGWPDDPHQQFAIEIYDDDGTSGAPGSLIYGPDTTGSVGNVIGGLPPLSGPPYPLNWAQVCIDPPLVITGGDFYIAKVQFLGNPDCEGIEIDNTTITNRAWQYDASLTTWTQVTDANYMIRAYTSQVLTYGDLEGTVTEAKGPIEGAIITAEGPETRLDTTDVNGYYSMTNLTAGDYDVTAEAAGYYDQTIEDVTVTAGMTTVQDFSLAVDTALLRETFCGTFPPAGWAKYELLDPAGWQQSTSGHDDACCAWHDDDYADCDDWLVTPALSIPAGKASYGLNFWEYWSLTSYYIYHGIWVSTGSGDPNDGEFVELMEVDTGAGYAWEAMGPISLAAYAGQTIYLAFVYQGYFADDWMVDDVVVDLMLTGNIGGNVAAAKGPIEDAIVTAGGLSDTTDASGDYLIEGLGVGTYDVTCTADGYFPAIETDVDVTADVTTTVNFTLSPIGVNDILLVDADGSAYYPDTVFTDVQAYFTDALTACGYTYDIWEKLTFPEDGPDATVMSYYDAVIWSCGEAWTGNQTLTANDETQLALYLDGGGKLFLDGQDYIYDVYGTTSPITFSTGQFPYDYLGVSGASQDVIWLNDPDVGTSDGHVGSLAEGLSYGLADIYTTKNETKSDSKHPDGLTIDELTVLDTGVLDADDGIDYITNGACQFESVKGFKTVFSTVCFAGLTEDYGHTRAELMCAIMDYLLAAPADMYISDGGVNPIIGNLSTPFTYTVTYTQLNDLPPTVKNVVIDGTPYAMTDPTGGAGPYAGGVEFTYVHTFSGGGDHEFHFDFSDGTLTDRLPVSGEYWGPMNGYYFYDFESGDGGFTVNGPNDDWEYGMPTTGPGAAHSGEYCWGTVLAGNYSDNSQSRLETPSLNFALGGGMHLELKFWHFYDSEGSYSPYDGGNVKLILPDTNFVIYPDLAQADDYDTYTMNSGNAWIPNEAAYFGPVSGWKEAIFDLTPWTNESDVKIAFDFGSDGSVSTYDGWYIDDVVIWGYPPLPVELAAFAATAGDHMVTLSWETRSELGNLGFELYRREAEGEFEKITAELIPGAGHSEATQTYAYVDRGLDNGTTYTYQLAAVDFGGNVRKHDVLVSATPTASLPTAFALSQNYPNPFNPNTEIKYQIPEGNRVVLKIYNVMGQEVVTLMDKDLKAGYYTATWDARDASGHEVSAGIYFCTLQAGEFSQTVKMVLLK